MKRSFFLFTVLLTTAVIASLNSTILLSSQSARGEQAAGAIASPVIPVSHHDRVYTADQFSNTVSVTDPIDNKLLGVIHLGDPIPSNLSPLYHGQLLVHGMGFSPDHHTIAIVSVGSNSIAFIDTTTNAIKHVTYVGRSPHEAFFTQMVRRSG
jgi:DNA-binding beta-propeller fold protein YncE